MNTTECGSSARPVHVVVLALLLLTSALFVALSSSRQTAGNPSTRVEPVAVSRVKIRIGTYNLNHDNHLTTFLTATHKMLPYVDVVAFQEVTGGTRQSHVEESIQKLKGWGVAGGVEYGDFVAYRSSRFQWLPSTTAVLAEGRPIEAPATGVIHFQHDVYGGVTRLRDRSTGRIVTIVSSHPMAGAAPGGRPRPHRPRLVAMYREIVTNLARLAPIQAHFGRVYLVGDYNIDYFVDARHRVSGFPYRQFTRIGYLSMWAGHRPVTGTRGHTVIDGVWARHRPIRRQVLASFRYSDHKPVVATYWLP